MKTTLENLKVKRLIAMAAHGDGDDVAVRFAQLLDDLRSNVPQGMRDDITKVRWTWARCAVMTHANFFSACNASTSLYQQSTWKGCYTNHLVLRRCACCAAPG